MFAPIMPTRTTELSLEEYLAACQQDGWFEWIDGERKPYMPGIAEHAEIIKRLLKWLLVYEAQFNTIAAYGESAYVLLHSSDWVKGSRIPDVMVYRAADLANYKAATPDWRKLPFALVPMICVEVISPNDSYSDVDEKVELYFRDGVDEVWVVNPRHQIVRVHSRDRASQRLDTAQTLHRESCLPSFALPLSALFGD